MKSAIAEITRISRALPPKKTEQLLSYARSLQRSPLRKSKTVTSAEKLDGDAEWERIINDPLPRPKLAAKIKQIEKLIDEGKDEPLDLERM